MSFKILCQYIFVQFSMIRNMQKSLVHSKWPYLSIHIFSWQNMQILNWERMRYICYGLHHRQGFQLLRPSSSVKSCAKYQFPEEIGEQCRGRCGQKHGTVGFYLLHVIMNITKFSLEVSIGAAYQRNDRLSSWLVWFHGHCEHIVVQEDGSQLQS